MFLRAAQRSQTPQVQIQATPDTGTRRLLDDIAQLVERGEPSLEVIDGLDMLVRESMIPDVVSAAAQALADLGVRSRSETLVDRLRDPATLGYRVNLLFALHSMGATVHVADLARLVIEPDEDAAQGALATLSEGRAVGSSRDFQLCQEELLDLRGTATGGWAQLLDTALYQIARYSLPEPFRHWD